MLLRLPLVFLLAIYGSAQDSSPSGGIELPSNRRNTSHSAGNVTPRSDLSKRGHETRPIPSLKNSYTMCPTSVTVYISGEPLNVMLDPGSDNLWVYDERCTSTVCKELDTLYSTHPPDFRRLASNPVTQCYETLDQTFFPGGYMDGQCMKMERGRATLELRDPSGTNNVDYSLDDALIGSAYDGTVTLPDDVSGMWGLGYPGKSKTKPTWMRLLGDGDKVFGVSTNTNRRTYDTDPLTRGWFHFGYEDSLIAGVGRPSWVPIHDRTLPYWNIELTSIATLDAAGGRSDPVPLKDIVVLPDFGVTHAIGPKQLVVDFYTAVFGSCHLAKFGGALRCRYDKNSINMKSYDRVEFTFGRSPAGARVTMKRFDFIIPEEEVKQASNQPYYWGAMAVHQFRIIKE